jgi:ribonuclease BN (tRNA processing enzyme)
MLRDAGKTAPVPLDVDHFAGVVLTHLHADHSSGLEGLAYFNYFYRQGKRTKLFAHPDVLDRIWGSSLAAGMDSAIAQPDGTSLQATLETFFDVTALSLDGRVGFGPFELEARTTVHPVPAALRIHAGGRTLGLSGDTAWDPTLIDWLSPSDLIVHETSIGIHTPYEKLAALDPDLRARMRLIHYPDDFDCQGSVIEPLVEGRRYEV